MEDKEGPRWVCGAGRLQLTQGFVAAKVAVMVCPPEMRPLPATRQALAAARAEVDQVEMDCRQGQGGPELNAM